MNRLLATVVAIILSLLAPRLADAQDAAPRPADDESGEASPEKGEASPNEGEKAEPRNAEPETAEASSTDGGDEGADTPVLDAKSTCLGSFGRAQRMRREAMLIEARQELLACAQDGCFDAVRVKCLQWLEEVDADLPTVVLAIKDKKGETPPDARVLIDGGGASAALGGRALEVNPGTHEMSVTLGSGERMVKKVTILQGQKNQSVVFDFTPPEEPRNTLPPQVIVREGGSVNVPALVAFGVGGAALVAGIITGGLALRDGDDLEAQCDEVGCEEDELNDYTLAHVSTATLVLAGVSTALGLTFLFVLDDEDDEPPKDVALTMGPAAASFRVRF